MNFNVRTGITIAATAYIGALLLWQAQADAGTTSSAEPLGGQGDTVASSPTTPTTPTKTATTAPIEVLPTIDLAWVWNPLSYQTPTPVPTPTPTRVPQPLHYEQPRPPGECPAIIVEVFGDTYAPAACSVAWCESRYNQYATGAAGERGWFQIHPIHADSTYDPLGNTLAAYRISSGGTNWGAWAVVCQP